VIQYSKEIDGLRAIAVLSVVLFHLGIDSVSGGFIGVDVFFTISGYLITGIILRDIEAGQFSILRFWQRRARRILPALFAVITACLVVSWFVLFPVEMRLFADSLRATLFFASNFLFWSETGYFDLASELKPLLHTWSLAVEEQFYLVIPWLLLLSHRAGKLALRIIFLLLFALSFIAAVRWVATDIELAFYWPHTRAWELLLGSLLAMGLVPKTQQRWLRESLLAAGVGGIVWASMQFSAVTPFPGAAALFPCLGAAIIIYAANSGPTFGGRLLGSRPMVFVGLISYSLYLWHWPIIVFIRYMTGDELSPAAQVLILVASLILAWASWRWIEMPVRNSKLWWGRKLLLGCVLITVLLATISTAIIVRDGVPSRFNKDLLSALDLQYQQHASRQCHFVNVERVDRGDICVRGATGVEPDFVFAGDSHADAISMPVFAAAEKLGVAGYQFTQAGFRPLPGVRRPGSLRGSKLADRFVQFLHDNPNIRVVILHGFWKVQATGESFRHSGVVYIDDDYDGSGQAYNRISFQAGLKRLTEQFPDRRFIILDDYPSGKEFDLNRLMRILHFSGRSAAGLGDIGGMTQARFMADQAEYRPLLDRVAEAGNVRVASLAETLCDEEYCYSERNGEILYRDGDHLTLVGAGKFTGFFVDLLSEALGLSPDPSPPGRP
jgi:peptidoglycan/LPS O-acetylase OafA/YrhL